MLRVKGFPDVRRVELENGMLSAVRWICSERMTSNILIEVENVFVIQVIHNFMLIQLIFRSVKCCQID